jgi:hypothetical protein
MTTPSPLPNFLGIGAPRAGTTWLHEVLDSHPDVLMPSRRKELNFFSQDYERGLQWYVDSFQLPDGGAVPPRVGEITPMYMYRDHCRERIAELGTVDRFIVCLRNPVDLLWSGYKQNSAIFDFRGDLAEFMDAFPSVVDNGYYARALEPWIEEFSLERFIFVQFDDLKRDPVQTRAAVAKGLGVDPARYPDDAGLEPVNRAVRPRFGRLYSYAKRTVTRLHRADRRCGVTDEDLLDIDSEAASLLALVVFAGIGLYDRLGSAQALLVVAGIWTALLVACPAWMRRFRFGPVEWLWRSLTYGQRQPLR